MLFIGRQTLFFVYKVFFFFFIRAELTLFVLILIDTYGLLLFSC